MRNSNDANMWCVTASWLVVVHVNRRKEKEKEGKRKRRALSRRNKQSRPMEKPKGARHLTDHL